MVECRDGVKLHTRIYFPRKYAEGDALTVVMDRSPYGQFGLELLDEIFVPAGFITVTQDMRGTGLSGGHFSDWHSDPDDAEDLGDWVTNQTWSNGAIYSFGASADGLGAFTTNYKAPSWLQSQYYIWTSSIGYEVIYPQGALLYNLISRWISGTVRDIDIDESYGEFMENEAKTSWWDALDFTGQYDLVSQKSKTGKFGFWAGWYDIFLRGTLAAFDGYNTQSDPSVQHASTLIIDPCGHCQDAAPFFTQDIIAGRTALAVMQIFEVFGVRPVARTDVKNITFYVMSSNDQYGRESGQFWSSVETFPEPAMTKYFFQGDGSISTHAPTSGAASTSFVFDPTNPQPSAGGNNLFSEPGCGPLDQATIDERDDVLVFQTPTLNEALPLTGPINAHLFLSSDAIDTDFMVRVSDVYPADGGIIQARLLQDSAVRMRWRNGGLDPEYMTKGEVYPATLSLWNTSYVLAPGHALRFSVSSSNYPRFSVNNNNGLLLADVNYPGGNVTATNVLHHSAEFPSHIELPVVTMGQLPKLDDIKVQFERAYPDVDYDKVIEKGPELIEKLTIMGRRGNEKK